MADSYVCTTAMMTCSFGVATCPLVVNPSRTVLLQGKQRANIGDFAPITNIASFGMCSSLINPTVASATAAAMGVLTPMPCIPAIVSPWMPGKPDLMVQGMPALTKSCTNMCMWQGQIKFVTDGQTPSPPPMTTPPPGKMSCVTNYTKSPLTQDEQAYLSKDEQERYNKEMTEASKSGTINQLMADVWEKTANEYAEKGETKKADIACQMAEKERNAAADKKNIIIGEVNQKYHQLLPISQEDIAKLSNSLQQEYKQKRANILEEREKAYKRADFYHKLLDNGAKNRNPFDLSERAANIEISLIEGICGAIRKHYAKKDADNKAYILLNQLNLATYQLIQQQKQSQL